MCVCVRVVLRALRFIIHLSDMHYFTIYVCFVCVCARAFFSFPKKVFTDGWFLAGMDEYTAKRLAQGSAAGPTYVYLFAHKGEASFTEIFEGGREEFYGNSIILFACLHVCLLNMCVYEIW